MRFGERKASFLSVKENIEMELFSSEESCVLTTTLEKEEEYCWDQRRLEHPLVPDLEEEEEDDEEAELHFETLPWLLQLKPKIETQSRGEVKQHMPVPAFMEDTEIEMEVFLPYKLSNKEQTRMKSDDPSNVTSPTLNRTHRLKWRRPAEKRTGLVVKDVVCLPRGHYLAQLDRPVVPRGKERADLAATGMTARITIDYCWSANQMESRLAALFRGRFVKKEGQSFSFTYLQCVQGSRALFVPDTPADGWTGEQVLRTAGYEAVYILSHQDYQQAQAEISDSDMLMSNEMEFCREERSVSFQEEDQGKQCSTTVCSPPEDVRLDLDDILNIFRQKNLVQDEELHIQVRRSDLLESALEEVRRPGFNFRRTPIISFIGEEDNSPQKPLKEFFRLTLLKLQLTSVFEGHPGRVFLTIDLAALEDRRYFEAGALIGWSLTHGGPGPRCLHPALYQLMSGQNPCLEDFTWRDIVDAKARTRLQELSRCTDMMLLSYNLQDWLLSCGIHAMLSAKCDEIPTIYSCLVKHYIFDRVSSMISQFTEGLNSCGGLWETVQLHWEAFEPVMTSSEQQPLTLETFRELFTVCYSPVESRLEAAEKRTVEFWETALTLITDGEADVSLEELLLFVTGSDHVPPLGFPTLIHLRFNSQEGSISGVSLPYASTCALELFLPTDMSGAEDMLTRLSRAMHMDLSFMPLQNEDDDDDDDDGRVDLTASL